MMARAIGPEIKTGEDSAVSLTIAGALVSAKLTAPVVVGVVNLQTVARNLKDAHDAVVAAAADDAVDDNQLARKGPDKG